MLKLNSNKNVFLRDGERNFDGQNESLVLKVTKNDNLPVALRGDHALLLHNPRNGAAHHWPLVLHLHEPHHFDATNMDVLLDANLDHLDEDDIIVFYPSEKRVKILYRKSANANSFLVTEQCNSFCLMCSQPPRDVEDNYLVKEILKAIPLIHASTCEIGITGGEPTLIGSSLEKIITKLHNYLPETAVHVLTNGRTLKDLDRCISLASIHHPDLMFGIPIYADYSQLHDFIVQADNAFDDTIRGILNLKRCRHKVEIRVVLHKQNYHRIIPIAQFIHRNLLFVDHVAFMGLELMGFARANLDALWIDPFYYKDELEEAIDILDSAGVPTSIYNSPLCLLGDKSKRHSARSISDWKQEYFPECASCEVKQECPGFFSSSSLRHSTHISPIQS